MARDWSEGETLALLEMRVAERAPGNTAPFPISCSKQQDDLGNWVWVVDVHVRIPGVTEYEVTGSSTTFADALRRAYLGLNNEWNLRRTADAANRLYGITP